jgi:hypothetical protein
MAWLMLPPAANQMFQRTMTTTVAGMVMAQ